MTDTNSIRRRLLGGWLAISGRFGTLQTRSILGLVYVFLIGPYSIALALLGKDLLAKRGLRVDGTIWQNADTAGPSLERAKLLS